MNAPWFNPMFAFLPGTLLGVTAGLWGDMAGMLAPKGKARGLVVGSARLLVVCGLLLLAAGLAALAQGQPYGVWYGLLLPGVILTLVVGINLPNLTRVYRQAEERRMRAEDAPL